MFGGTHAPCCVSATDKAEEFMETLPVQLAGTAAPTAPASSLSGTPTGDDSFASKFGRALAGMSESGQDGASIDPKAPTRAKPAPDNSADSAATVSLNCLVTTSVEPLSDFTGSTGSTETSISRQSATTESSADSLSNFASGPIAPTDEAGAPAAKPPPPPAAGASVTEGTSAAGTAQIAVLMQPARVEIGATPRITAARGGEESTDGAVAARGHNDEVLTVGQNPLADAVAATSARALVSPPGAQGVSVSNPPAESTIGVGRSESKRGSSRPANVPAATSVSGLAWFNGLQSTTVSNPSAELTVVGGQSRSKSLQASTPSPGQYAGPWQDSQAAPGFNNSGTLWDSSYLAPVPTAPTPPSRQDLPVPSDSTPPIGETGHAALKPPTIGTDPSIPSLGQAEQAAAPVPQTSAPSTAPIANSHAESAEFSAALGKFSKTEMTVNASKSGTTVGAVHNDKLTAESGPGAISAPQNSPGKIAYQLVQSPIASKYENPVNSPAKATLDLPNSDTKEVAGRAAVEAEAGVGDVKAPLVPPTAASSDQFFLNSPTPGAAIAPRNDTTSGGSGIQRSVVMPASFPASNAQASTFDSSTSGHGKSGQQNAPGPGDGSATFVHSIANSPGPDPAGSLLTSHTPSVPAIHANTSTHPTPLPSSSAQQATTLSAWQNYDGGAGKIVRSASLTESVGGGEMHVELRSGPMGPIEVHTVVRNGSVGAEIHVQGQEAHKLLSAGLPSLERALTDRNLRVENIGVYQDHTGGGMSGGGRQDSPSDSSPSPHHQALPWDDPPPPRSTARGQLSGEESATTAAGLSVQA